MTGRAYFLTTPAPAVSKQRKGFALIISLSLMSFVVLVVVLLATQLRLSVAASSADRAVVEARETAQLGLAVAVAELQRHAGPDRRVTARAEILGVGNFTPDRGLWTGAWDSVNPGRAPEWLVSGERPDPNGPPSERMYSILPATPARAATIVPMEELSASSGVVGRFAWWAGGNAAAAPLAGGRLGTIIYEDAAFEGNRRRMEYVSPFGVNLSSLFPAATVDDNDLVLATRLERLRSFEEDFVIVDSRDLPLGDATELAAARDDYSPFSFGVLENPLDGGLKRNLSDINYRDGFLANDDLSRFLGPKNGFLDVEDGVPDRRTYAGKPFFSPRPILSEAVLYMGLFHTWSDAKVRIRFHMEAEFWNPYSLPLRFPLDPDTNYDRAVVLLFEGLPTVTLVAENLSLPRGWAVPDLEEDLNDLESYPDGDSRKFLNSWFDISPSVISGGRPTLEPGEVYRVLEPNPATQQRGLARDFGTVRWSGNQQSRPNDDADVRITSVHPAGGVSLKMVPYESAGNIQGRDVIQEFEGISFDDFEVVKPFRSGTNPFSRPTSSSYTLEDYVFAYHFRVASDETDMLSLQDIQTAVDLREPIFRSSETYENLDGVTLSKADLIQPIQTDPSFIVQDDSNLFSLQDQITDGTLATLGEAFERSHDFGYRKMVLYDIPDGDAISVGQLNSLSIHRRAPRSIGNPWGAELNEAFDFYYLSPKLTNPTPGAGRLRGSHILGNPWLSNTAESVAATAGEDDAADELIHGAFNVNSISVNAWRAVLSAPVLTPRGEDESARGRGEVFRENSFFRLPTYQSEGPEFYLTEAGISEADQFFAQGIRVLDSEQVDEIAAGLVEALQTRGGPFFSLSEFVNSGVVAEAIANVGTRPDSTATPINEDVMAHSNVFLEQSDILTRIAPFAAVRSDTFRVRAYGEAVNPITGEAVAKTLCEAVVQRISEKLDGSDPITPTSGLADSRRFRILSLRWIDES